MSQFYQESVSINPSLIGLILGKGRSNLKIIEDKYDLKIFLRKDGPNNILALKSVSKDNLDLALKDLKVLIADKADFYESLQAQKKRYQQKLAQIRLKKKENELRRKNILGVIEEKKTDPKEDHQKALNRNPFAMLSVSDSEEEEINPGEESDQESEIEYYLIDQSDIPPHSPTLEAIREEFSSDYEDDGGEICQKCIDEGRTSCPCLE